MFAGAHAELILNSVEAMTHHAILLGSRTAEGLAFGMGAAGEAVLGYRLCVIFGNPKPNQEVLFGRALGGSLRLYKRKTPPRPEVQFRKSDLIEMLQTLRRGHPHSALTTSGSSMSRVLVTLSFVMTR